MKNHADDSSSSLRNLPPPWDILLPLSVRIFVWGMLFGVLYLLHSFFLLIFLTFIFSYIQGSGVSKLDRFIRNRTLRVILVALAFVGLIISTGAYLSPRVKSQATNFVRNYRDYIYRIDNEVAKLSLKFPILKEIDPTIMSPQEVESAWEPSKSPTMHFLESEVLGLETKESGGREIERFVSTLGDIGSKIATIVSSFLLALLFSFLILLDLPSLKRGVTNLRYTRIGFIYDEVAGSIISFSRVLGQAFEAQLLIAIANTALTATGIYLLGLGNHVAFLSVIVFLCSFIPVAGVFISSIPICLIAIQTSGLDLVFLSVMLIAVVHLVEGYVLNPRIYGSRMHLNPVIVLMILTIGGELFHVWGFILGVPVATYIFGHAIRKK